MAPYKFFPTSLGTLLLFPARALLAVPMFWRVFAQLCITCYTLPATAETRIYPVTANTSSFYGCEWAGVEPPFSFFCYTLQQHVFQSQSSSPLLNLTYFKFFSIVLSLDFRRTRFNFLCVLVISGLPEVINTIIQMRFESSIRNLYNQCRTFRM